MSLAFDTRLMRQFQGQTPEAKFIAKDHYILLLFQWFISNIFHYRQETKGSHTSNQIVESQLIIIREVSLYFQSTVLKTNATFGNRPEQKLGLISASFRILFCSMEIAIQIHSIISRIAAHCSKEAVQDKKNGKATPISSFGRRVPYIRVVGLCVCDANDTCIALTYKNRAISKCNAY